VKTIFQQACESAIPLEDFRKKMHKRVKAAWQNSHSSSARKQVI